MSGAIWDRPIILCNITAIKTNTIVVIMCDLFRWKLIYCLFISVLSFENQLSEGKVGITLTDLTHHIFVSVVSQDLNFQRRQMSWSFLCSMRSDSPRNENLNLLV
jgi:hypothetical protein